MPRIWGSTWRDPPHRPGRHPKMLIMTTYIMPLNYLVDQLWDYVGIFLDIQLDIVVCYYPMTLKVKAAVETVYESLQTGTGCWSLASCEDYT